MPDFPQIGGATPAEVWAYATRRITNIDDARAAKIDNLDQTISQVKADILVEPATDKIDGSQIDASVASRSSHAPGDILLVPAEKIDAVKLDATIASRAPASEYDAELDVVVSSRAPAAEYDIEMAHLDADISSRSSHAPGAIWTEATRTITALTGTPRTDLIGEDASFEAATGRPAKIPRLDNIPAYETPVESSILMDGSEQILVSKEDNKIGLLDGYVDLSSMDTDDVIVIRQSMQVKAEGTYVKYAEETYSGPQTIPLLHIVTKTAKDKIKVTAEQTNVAYKTLDVQFYRRVQG